MTHNDLRLIPAFKCPQTLINAVHTSQECRLGGLNRGQVQLQFAVMQVALGTDGVESVGEDIEVDSHIGFELREAGFDWFSHTDSYEKRAMYGSE